MTRIQTVKDKKTFSWNEQSLITLSQQLGEPLELLERRREAMKRLQHTPWPHIMQEAWRRTDPREIGPHRYDLWGATPEGALEDAVPLTGKLDGRPDSWSLLHLANCSQIQRIVARNHSSVSFGSLQDGLTGDRRDGLVEDILEAPEDDESPAVSLLHLAYYQGGSYVYIPPNSDTVDPIRLVHQGSTPGSGLFPLNLLKVGEHGRATIILEQDAIGGTDQWFCGMTRIGVEDGARLDMVVINRGSPSTKFYDHLRVKLGRDASFHLTWADLNPGWSVVRRESVADAPGSEAYMRGVHVGSGDSRIDARTSQDHPAPETTSDMLYKAVLFGKSKSVYQGVIIVKPDAVGANAYQLNRNLLLSPDATADSIPKLEILVDEVRCTHGASVGKVDKDALFYLMSRGLPEALATQLLIQGFLTDAAEQLPEGKVKELWLDRVLEETAKSLRG